MKFRKEKSTTTAEGERPVFARGGVSVGAVLTGVVVAFGAMFLLSALVGGVLAATGVDADELAAETTREAGLGATIAFIVAMFLAYLWGGYTAGRMGRGAGAVNGLLVPVLALIIGAIVVAIVTAMGADANLNLPFNESQLPVEGERLVDFGTVAGIVALAAMFVGGILGGMLGSRWHTKLERRAIDERESQLEERRRADVETERDQLRDERDAARRETVVERRPAAPPPPSETTGSRSTSDSDVTTERRPAPPPRE
jgi:hypothetical protein